MYSKFFKTQSIDIDLLSNFDYIIWMDASISITNKNYLIAYQAGFYIFEHAF